MYPEIIIGSYIFRGEGLLTFLAVFGCFVHLFFFTVSKSGYSRLTFVNAFISTFAVGMIGEVVVHYLIWDFEAFSNNPEIIITKGFMQFSGNSILGGVFGGVVGLWIYCKILKINYLHFFSCFIIVIPLWKTSLFS